MSAARPGSGAPEGRGLPRSARIHRARDIRRLLEAGERRKTSHLDVFVSPSPFHRSRAGVIVPRHRQSIVRRNRVKRRLREILRVGVLPHLRAAGLALDVLVRARREAYEATYAMMRDELAEVTEELCSRRRS